MYKNNTTKTTYSQEEFVTITEGLLLDIVSLFRQKVPQLGNIKLAKPCYERDTDIIPDERYQIIKDYNGLYKITTFKRGDPTQKRISDMPPRGTSHDQKLWNNISRAKAKVYEYSLCNEFEYFITLTVDRRKYDRYNLKEYIRALGRWLDNYNRREYERKKKVEYVLIPEMHKDGAWHLHGLIRGINKDQLKPFTKGKHPLPLVKGKYLNWEEYAEEFGFCSLGKIKDYGAVSGYITKYITKTMVTQCRELNSKLYYNTHGLNKAVEVARGEGIIPIDYRAYDFSNEYVSIKWVDVKGAESADE